MSKRLSAILFIIELMLALFVSKARAQSPYEEGCPYACDILSLGESSALPAIKDKPILWRIKTTFFQTNRYSDCSLRLADSAEAVQARYPFESDSFHWPSFLGGDFFVTADIYPLHFNAQNTNVGLSGGLGVEVRIRPTFFGYIWGGCTAAVGDLQVTTFNYQSIYAGTSLHRWRLDVGATNVGDHESGYVALFADVSRRYSGIIFFEPELRIMFPVAGRLVHVVNSEYAPPQYYYATQHFRLSDMFIGLSLKLGIGYN